MTITQIWKESDGQWSWGRVASTATVVSAIWSLVHVVLHSHAIPDASTLAGLMAWAIGPYGVNKAATAFAKAGNL